MAEAMPGAEALREAIELPQRYRSLWGDAVRRFSRNRSAMLGLIVILILATMAALAPVIQRHDPTFQNYSSLRESPNGEFWLGTDLLGRDQWSRLVHGARISLSVGILTEAVALTIGMIVGLTAALGGRGLDNLMMRVTDVAYAFPDLLMLILLLEHLRAQLLDDLLRHRPGLVAYAGPPGTGTDTILERARLRVGGSGDGGVAPSHCGDPPAA